MKVLIIANYTSLPGDNGNSRFPYIAELLSDNNENEVELITSSFRHIDKKQREIHLEIWEKLPYKVTTIYEPRYRKNISLKRFYSHWKMSKNLKTYLEKMNKKPDVIYCAVPSLDLAKEAANFAKRNKIRFIIDIQDLWPEAFKMVFKVPVLKDILFLPWQIQANSIYKKADEIVAVSETYVNRAARVNKKYKNKLSVFLGTDLDYFDKCKEENKVERNDKKIKIAYIGTLGHSYNIKCIIDAIKILNEKQYNNIEFMVMGDGPLKSQFEEYAKNKNVKCVFTGKLPYPQMVGNLCACDIAVNPITKGAAQSIINKVGDYASAGLPVINTLENKEYRELVEKYNIGYNCSNENIEEIANAIEELMIDIEKRNQLGLNNRNLAEEKFDRKTTYPKVVELVVKCESNKKI